MTGFVVFKVSEMVKMFVGKRECDVEVCCVYTSRLAAEKRIKWLNDHRVSARLIIEKEEQ